MFTSQYHLQLGEDFSKCVLTSVETPRPYRHKHFKDEFIQRAIIETVSDGENGKEIKIVYLRDVCVLQLTAPNIELAQEFENTNAWAY